MIKQVTKKERDRYIRMIRSHTRDRDRHTGRRFVEIDNKVYETTGCTLNEIHAFQKRLSEQKSNQTTLL